MIAASQHSAEVGLTLVLGDKEISLHAVGPDSVTLREDVHVPVGPAHIRVEVDGQESLSHVNVPSGVPTENLEVAVELLPD